MGAFPVRWVRMVLLRLGQKRLGGDGAAYRLQEFVRREMRAFALTDDANFASDVP